MLVITLFSLLFSPSLCSPDGDEDSKLPYMSGDSTVDLTHPEYANRQCEDTAMKKFCWRNCTVNAKEGFLTSSLNKYKGLDKIKSPTFNKSMYDYDLKQLKKIYDMGKTIMDATQKTPLFDLVAKVINENMLRTPLEQKLILDIVELQLNWFLLIFLGVLLIAFLTLFVTFSILDGIFGWTSSIKRQQRLPSNATWVNILGVAIGISTVIVLLGCLLAWVGNLLVTENKHQARVQGLKDYGWSQNYAVNGRDQFKQLIDQFTEQLFPEEKRLYNESIHTASVKMKAGTKTSEDNHMAQAKKLKTLGLDKLATLTAFNLMINNSVQILKKVTPEAETCFEQIPKWITIYCTSKGHATDMVKCFPSDSGPEVDDDVDPTLYLKMPDVTKINGTTANTTGIDSVILANVTKHANLAIAQKLYTAAQAGQTRWNNIYSTLWTRSKTWREAYYLLLTQTARIARSQYVALADMQVTSERSMLRGQQWIQFFLGDDSNVSNVNGVRYKVFIYVIVLSAVTVCIGTGAWCVGCCNFNEKQWPTQRDGISHTAGLIMYYTSYIALFLSLFTLMCGLIYFIPTSLFNFTCQVFESPEHNIFMFYDEEVIVKKQILGEYVHDNPDYNLTFKYFIDQCEKDESLYRALKLHDRWDLTSVFSVNETMDTTEHISLLKTINFQDQYLMMPAKVVFLKDLDDCQDDLEFEKFSTQINSSTHLFGQNMDHNALKVWLKNFKVFDKEIKKIGGKYDATAPNFAAWTKYKATCQKTILDGDDGWEKDSKKLEGYLKNFDSMYSTLKAGMVATKKYAESTYKAHQKAENEWLVTIAPLKLNNTIDLYEGYMVAEIDCFVYTAGGQVEYELGQCRTLYDVFNGSMTYFCQFLVGPMTVTWLSMFMVGGALTLYIQLARAVSMYFLRMDEIHPDDIRPEDIIKAMTEDT